MPVEHIVDVRPLLPYNPTPHEVRTLIEHTYNRWDEIYGSYHENVKTGHILTPYGEKEQMYERRKHVAFMSTSPEYAHYVCIKAVRYCRTVRR